MNISVLSKCVEELKKESPDIRYILGMLETLITLTGNGSTPIHGQVFTPKYTVTAGSTPATHVGDEGDLPPGYATGPIGRIG